MVGNVEGLSDALLQKLLLSSLREKLLETTPPLPLPPFLALRLQVWDKEGEDLCGAGISSDFMTLRTTSEAFCKTDFVVEQEEDEERGCRQHCRRGSELKPLDE